MVDDLIHKKPDQAAQANMPDYSKETEVFSWAKARGLLGGLADGKLNIAHECVDRHVANGAGAKVALRIIRKNDDITEVTYDALFNLTNRFANVLQSLGLAKGERVFSLLGRTPQLYVVALGTLKAGLVFSPLFSAFGPEPLQARMEIGGARVLVTTNALYRRKVAPIRDRLPELQHVLLIDAEDDGDALLDFDALLQLASTEYNIEATEPEDVALLHFTSGTTGRPKGAVHVHEAIVAHCYTGRVALDLKPDDVYWCTADPGWVTGTSYGIIAPLAIGVTMVIDEAEFDIARWYRILESERVSVWYTAPTAIRMLMAAGAEAAKNCNLSQLRFMASVGEPLNPEAVLWSAATFGKPFHDNWWQTETGGIMIANYASMDVKPGSMGRPLPGIVAGIVERENGKLHHIDKAMCVGELALKTPWPSMMRAYLDEEERYNKCFSDGWYLTGDLAMRDSDGYFWFIGRSDDVIKSSGHLIGPFEVESALIEHEAVAEAAVIGLPDETAGEVVKAYVALNPGFRPDKDLQRSLRGHARQRLGPAVAPREILFREKLPKTRSGKIMRRLLKAREMGLPEGDISTLETDEK
ncbi:MAG: acetate--CoA ligase [Alphaproteobacteria bacterium]|nr:acetate--CoA ligase [Alphaproteobacteria bacterium]